MRKALAPGHGGDWGNVDVGSKVRIQNPGVPIPAEEGNLSPADSTLHKAKNSASSCPGLSHKESVPPTSGLFLQGRGKAARPMTTGADPHLRGH